MKKKKTAAKQTAMMHRRAEKHEALLFRQQETREKYKVQSKDSEE